MKFIQVHKFKFINGKFKAPVSENPLNVPCREGWEALRFFWILCPDKCLARDTNNLVSSQMVSGCVEATRLAEPSTLWTLSAGVPSNQGFLWAGC